MKIMDEPTKIDEWARISILGSGAFGVVSLWRSNLDDYIAVKKCKIQCPTTLSKKQKERWHREVQTMKELNHPNIVKYKPLPYNLKEVLEKSNPSNLPLLSMEYCTKGNLRYLLNQPLNLRGLKEKEVKILISDITNALRYLHENNITHRDIKPENIVLNNYSERKEDTIFKLTDLGYAKELNDTTLSFVGSLYYLAPEILANQKYDNSVDYWSFGILIFEIITGIIPFSTTLSPAQRYHKLKNKGDQDICIYETTNENYEYSTKLYEENYITKCLKKHIETWLYKSLQFNPKLRRTSLNSNLFDELNDIINKKILLIFSVNTYQFYSYEFFDSTTILDVKVWLAHDIEIDVKDLLIFGENLPDNQDNETLLINVFQEKQYELFAFKKGCLFDKISYKIPERVKFLFKNLMAQLQWKEIKAIYSDSIYYIQQDIFYVTAFSKAMNCYIDHLNKIFNETESNASIIFNKMFFIKETLKKVNINITVTSNIKKCIEIERLLQKQIKYLKFKINKLNEMYILLDVIKLTEIEELLKKAVQLIQKTANDSNRDNIKMVQMCKIVSDVMKLKTKFILNNKNLTEIFCHLDKSSNHLELLESWMKSFNLYIEPLIVTLDALKFSSSDLSVLESNTNYEKFDFIYSKMTNSFNDAISDYKKNCTEIDSFLSSFT